MDFSDNIHTHTYMYTRIYKHLEIIMMMEIQKLNFVNYKKIFQQTNTLTHAMNEVWTLFVIQLNFLICFLKLFFRSFSQCVTIGCRYINILFLFFPQCHWLIWIDQSPINFHFYIVQTHTHAHIIIVSHHFFYVLKIFLSFTIIIIVIKYDDDNQNLNISNYSNYL